MKEKKNIDQLFSERFENFEATPSPKVWNNLEAKLQEKKKKDRVVPLWWRVAGVAALLALLLTVGISLFDSGTNPSQEIVEQENGKGIDASPSEEFYEKAVETNKADDAIVQKNTEESSNSDLTENETISNKKRNPSINNAVTESSINVSEEKNKTNKELQQPQPKKASTIYNTKEDAVAVSTETNKKPSSNSSETTENPLVKDNKTVVSEKEAVAKNNNKTDIPKTIIKENTLFEKEKEITPSNTETGIANEESDDKRKSIFDAIKENEALEKELQNPKEKPTDRWAVAPNVGPVYYSSLSNGSSLDPMFSDNTQEGEVNLSYGVQVAYDISKKISIRSGVNNVNLSYATGDVQVASAPVAFGLEGVDYGNNRDAVTTVFDRNSELLTSGSQGLENITPKSTGGNAEISQRINYFEVPLELKYAMLDRKFGIDLIGGMSTLFLGNNEVVVSDGAFRTVIGEANNLNSISFTTNIGLGFNYQLSKKFRFNIEPMFKYQLNPYTDSSIDFRPYYLGVYSGLSFKF